jgi:ribulose-phosphate 3-epimerase
MSKREDTKTVKKSRDKRSVIVAPSLLSADPLKFGEEIRDIESAGADWHHVDVMDGHFVPNLTFGLPLIEALRESANLPLDVHIMISNPEKVALDYVKAGADYLTFHIEVVKHSHRLAEAIRQGGAKVGVALNPGTALEFVEPLLNFVDMVLIMSVNPGFGGQSFIPQMVDKVAALHQMLQTKNLEDTVLIQVDGGINPETGTKMVRAGASVLVAGSYIYGSKNREQAIAKLRQQTERALKS